MSPPRRRNTQRRQRRAHGSITQRGPEKWGIRWFVGTDYVTGKRRYGSSTINGSRMDAVRALSEACSSVRRDSAAPPTVQEFVARWVTDILAMRVSKKTLRSYSDVIRPLLTSYGSVRLDKLKTSDLQALYAEEVTKGQAPRTVRYLHTVLSQALDYAVNQNLIGLNPAKSDGLTLPRSVRREATVWNIGQTATFLEAVKDSEDYLLWYTLLHTGMRPGEAFGLQWRDFDGNKLRIVRAISEIGGVCEVKEPKTRAGVRSIVLTPEHVALLEAAREQDREAFIFKPRSKAVAQRQTGAGLNGYAHDNRPSARMRFAVALARVNRDRESAGLSPLPLIRLYDLRHSHATALLHSGVHPKIVADRMGHSNITVTLDTYSHVLPTMQEDAMAVYARAFPDSHPKV
jgi:integrase